MSDPIRFPCTPGDILTALKAYASAPQPHTVNDAVAFLGPLAVGSSDLLPQDRKARQEAMAVAGRYLGILMGFRSLRGAITPVPRATIGFGPLDEVLKGLFS